MKKLLCICLIFLCLTGCSKNDTPDEKEPELPIATCKFGPMTTETGTITMEINYSYNGKAIEKQEQKSKMVVPNDAYYQMVLGKMERIKSMYDEIKGVSYTTKEDKDNLTLSETIILDYTSMTKEDIMKTQNIKDDNFTYIDLDKTLKNLESQQFTCTK